MTALYPAATDRPWKMRDICSGVSLASPDRFVELRLATRASARVSAPVDGAHHGTPDEPIYRSFHRGEQRGTDPETLAAQLRACACWDPRPQNDLTLPL